jgi:hypothetical protein
MNQGHAVSRRTFLATTAAAGAAAWVTGARRSSAADAAPAHDATAVVANVRDEEIRKALWLALEKTVLPAAVENAYPGHFWITADGAAYGGDSTWPGLDSWQLAGAYLLLGRQRMVLDYFDFVQASQRPDGHIPFAVFPGEVAPDRSTYLRSLRYPEDVFTFKPAERGGRRPHTNMKARKWVGMFEHWQPKANPLTTLGPVCFVLTAAEMFGATKDAKWLGDKLPSIEKAADWLSKQRGPDGLIHRSGFYTELPPRRDVDGVTQCYAVHAFRELAAVCETAERRDQAQRWSAAADELTQSFRKAFLRPGGHFAEYVHFERGVIDSHGLSDVNFAAIAFALATDDEARALWPKLTAEKAFWAGDMPTMTVTKPLTYEPWEFVQEPLPFPVVSPVNDVAAMGRVWHLDALACRRMKDDARLVESVKRVCRAGAKSDGLWYERYHPTPEGGAKPAGSRGYGEYPAVLTRVVLGNPSLFAK